MSALLFDPIIPPFGPALYWALDPRNGAVDLSPFARHGTVQGGAPFIADAPPGLNGSIDLDGVDDYITSGYGTRRNLLSNPSFEIDTAQWGPLGATASIARSTAQAKYGSASLAVTLSGGSVGHGVQLQPATPGIPGFVAGDQAAIAVELWGTSGRAYRLKTIFYDAANAQVGGGITVADVTGTGGWQRLSEVVTVPTNATQVDMWVTADHTTAETFYIDAAITEKAAAVGDYFDGSGYVDSSGAFVLDNGGKVGWLGTAHASASDKGCFANGTVRTFCGVAWRDTDDTNDALFVSHPLAGAGDVGVLCYLPAGTSNLNFDPQRGLGGTAESVGAWPGAGRWVPWAVVFDEATNALELYIDGASKDTTSSSDPYHASAGTFGIAETPTVGAVEFGGKMALAAVYERGLTPGEIAHLHERAMRAIYKRTELDLHSGPFSVAFAGIDWGDAQIEQYLAEAKVGSIPVDHRIPNRQIRVPLGIMDSGSKTYIQAARELQAKVAQIQREGGALRRTWDGGELFCDLVNATLRLPDTFRAEKSGIEPDAELVLEAIPDFYGHEELAGSGSGTGHLVLALQNSKGNHPGRVRALIKNEGAADQLGLLFCARSSQVGEATAQMVYDATALTPLGAAAVSGDVVQHAALSPSWTPVLGSEIAGTGHVTHVGAHRVWVQAIVPDANTGEVSLRLEWFVGDPTRPTQNRIVIVPVSGARVLVDLGECIVPRARSGPQRWEFRVLAQSSAIGDDVQLRRVLVVSTAEASGRVIAGAGPTPTASLEAYDPFNQTAGNLGGKAAELGGAWARVLGDTDEASVDATEHDVTRSTSADALVISPIPGIVYRLGTAALAHTDLQIDQKLPATGADDEAWGLALLRYVDASNYLLAARRHYSLATRAGSARTEFTLHRVIAGARSQIAQMEVLGQEMTRQTIRVLAEESGRVRVWSGTQGNPTTVHLDVTDSALATGGALASGGFGFGDGALGSPGQRRYGPFTVETAAVASVSDAVLYASERAELRSDGYYRAAAGGPMSPVPILGDNPRQPVSGAEGDQVEWLIRPTRGDFGSIPDSADDAISATVLHRPSWLTIPG